jgi:putative membrane protein
MPYVYGPAMWGISWVFPFLAMLLMAVVAVVLVRAFLLSAGGHHPDQGDAALDVLRRRYAGGEITQEQFQEMRRTLGR